MNKKKTPFKCDLCDIYFSARRSLVRHNNSTHTLSKFFCEKCQKMFARKDNLNHHYRVKHKELRAPSMKKKRIQSSNSTLNGTSNSRSNDNPPQTHSQQTGDSFVSDGQTADSFASDGQTHDSNGLEEDRSNVFNNIDADERPPEADGLQLKIEVETNSEVASSMFAASEEHQQDADELNRLTEAVDSKPAESVAKPNHRNTCCSREELDFTVLDILHQNALDSADEDLMFFKSMLPDLKRIPKSKRIKVKAKIVAIIAEELESD